MSNVKHFRRYVQAFSLMVAGLVAGCQGPPVEEQETQEPPIEQQEARDAIRVTSNSQVFNAVARSMVEPCNLPAEFGRCGCYMDGLRTSCELVARCLEVGFCKALITAESDSTSATSQSEVFTSVAESYQRVCNNPAEFGRCGCFLDGLQTSCSVVHRCLENGFCEVATE